MSERRLRMSTGIPVIAVPLFAADGPGAVEAMTDFFESEEGIGPEGALARGAR